MTRCEAWTCEAYGPPAEHSGARCFLADRPGERVCRTRAECGAQMAAERTRVYDRMRELAAAGDPLWRQLAGEFAAPDELLCGDEPPSTRSESRPYDENGYCQWCGYGHWRRHGVDCPAGGPKPPNLT